MGRAKGRDSGCISQKGSWVSRAHRDVCLHTFLPWECIWCVSEIDLDAHNAYHRHPVMDGYQASVLG